MTRRTRFELKKAEDRDHIVQGLLIAQANIDEVVKIIKESRDREAAGLALMARFGLSQLQVNAILEMRLHQLTNLAVADLTNMNNELVKQIAYYEELLASRVLLMGVVKTKSSKSGRNTPTRAAPRSSRPRRNQRRPDPEGHLRDHHLRHGLRQARPSFSLPNVQSRGGKGVIGMQTKEEDVDLLLTACTHDYLLFFTNRGLMHPLAQGV